MLKRILGEAPYRVLLEGKATVVPDRKTTLVLVFESSIEYDLPLSCSLKITSSLRTDMCEFDVVLPAEGKTKKELAFTVPKEAKIIGGVSVAELEIIDRILDSRTVYELELSGEMAYKCSNSENEAFAASCDAVYTRDGRFFGNKGEIISLEIPMMSETETELSVISGIVRDFADGQIIHPTQGLNRILFEMQEDACFEFVNPVSGEKMLLQTLNTKYYI